MQDSSSTLTILATVAYKSVHFSFRTDIHRPKLPIDHKYLQFISLLNWYKSVSKLGVMVIGEGGLVPRRQLRAEGPACVLGMGTANPPTEFLQEGYPDFFFNITNCSEKEALKSKFQRICKLTIDVFDKVYCLA